jgi:hypothetical protein
MSVYHASPIRPLPWPAEVDFLWASHNAGRGEGASISKDLLENLVDIVERAATNEYGGVPQIISGH